MMVLMSDPLDHLRNLLSGIVPADILDSAIATVRKEVGGGAAYIHSPIRERVQSIQSALLAGVPCAAIAAQHGISTKAVYYHRKRL